MSNRPLFKTGPTVPEVCRRFGLKAEARSLFVEGMGCREFLEALVANQHYLAGVDFIAHALPARETIWWGCLCLQYACGDNLSAPDQAACRAAVRWVLQPTEENRAAAKVPAESAGPGSAAGALAAAASQTGNGHLPSKTSPESRESFEPTKAVSGAVKIAISKVEPVKIIETQRLFVELGIGVAEGRFAPPGSGAGQLARKMSMREN